MEESPRTPGPAGGATAGACAARPPLVAAVEMGYGHLRAAHALADGFGVEVARADLPPLASSAGAALWRLSRSFYCAVSRGTQDGMLSPLCRPALETLTCIEPLDGARLARSTLASRHLDRLARGGFGGGAGRRAEAMGVPLLTTFFVPALAADRLGLGPIYCVVTDSDLSRAWVPAEPAASRIHYLAPTERARDRLLAYGVPPEAVRFTGFPLPGALLGGPELPALRRNLADRLARLDPGGRFREGLRAEIEEHLGTAADGATGGPVRVTYAVGGAGAQAELARRLLRGLRPLLERGEVRLSLVAGARATLAARFEEWTREEGLAGGPVEIVLATGLDDYFRGFDRLLAETDVLWTKPSELSFFAALGLPLLLAPPVGAHERLNRDWLLESGAACDQGAALEAGASLRSRIAAGTFARAAWSGFRRLPKRGLYRIMDAVAG